MFRTAPDLGHLLKPEGEPEPRKLSRALLEVLSIIAYHQPVTRTEIEQIRGVQMNKGVLDQLLETGFVRMRGRRRSPGRPVTFGTSEGFLIAFGLDRISDLPSLEEIVASGLAEGRIPPGLSLPLPSDIPGSGPDEDPLEDDIFEVMAEERLEALAQEPPLEPDAEAPQAERPSVEPEPP
jgi:segregation and condensation protein B